MILSLYKERGETPLQCLERFRLAFPEYKDTKMTYLGRLDPMASGVFLVATDNDTSQTRREEFLALDKDYDFSVLFGFATDTYDCLGKITHPPAPSLIAREGESRNSDLVSIMDLIKIGKIYEGERLQKYPKYSSPMIAKRKTSPSPLLVQEGEDASFPFPAQGEGELDEGGVYKKITIYQMQFKSLSELSAKELFGRLLLDIGRVRGDFRQVEILELWQKNLKDKDKKYFVANFSASVSSGTYIRSIVDDLGATLGCGACALSITRTRVGNYSLKDAIKF